MTAVPALVATILVVHRLGYPPDKVMADISEGEDHFWNRAPASSGWQFCLELRYPGADGKTRVRDFLINKYPV